MDIDGFRELLQTLNLINQALGTLNRQLAAGVAISSSLPDFVVASLPATAGNGALAFASNARKAAEGPGAGTGQVVYFNGATSAWLLVRTDAAPTT